MRIRNDSDLRLELAGAGSAEGLTVPTELVIAPGGTSLLEIEVPRKSVPGTRRLQLDYTVRNLLVAPDEGLRYPIVVEVEVLPAAR